MPRPKVGKLISYYITCLTGGIPMMGDVQTSCLQSIHLSMLGNFKQYLKEHL
jgi:hypothetical protein